MVVTPQKICIDMGDRWVGGWVGGWVVTGRWMGSGQGVAGSLVAAECCRQGRGCSKLTAKSYRE